MGKERVRKASVRLHRALIKSMSNISIPPRHWGITERLSQSQLILAAILLFHLTGWNMQLDVFVHPLTMSSRWSQPSRRTRTLTTRWWELEMHVSARYIKVSDNATLIFICSDGIISFFFFSHYHERTVLIFRQSSGWVGGFVHFCMVSQQKPGK